MTQKNTKKPKMKIFVLTVVQELRYEATDITQAGVIAVESGVLAGQKNGAFLIKETTIKESGH